MDKQYEQNWQIPKHKKIEFFKKKYKYCLCIPVINEGERFKKELRIIKSLKLPVDIIIADGGSNDGSTDKNFLKKNNIRTLLIKQDKGKLSAQLRMGYAYALKENYQGIITIDGNGKDDPNDIKKFIKALNEGFDYIQGSRFIKGGKAINTPLLRLIGNRIIHAPLISLFSGLWLTDTTNGFRAYSQKYLLDERVLPFRDIFLNYELLFYLSVRAGQLGYKVIEVPVTRKYPKGKVPTKINIIGYFNILLSLLKVVFGFYNP
ncbi:MAG: dolichol-phosphate mannosyltransferase [Patescibacteria group bacterium]|nr:MAG: dolichol-phosphate mannosyltransferase [Patescibacteria group bacterium]